MYWTSSSGRIELNITKKQAAIGSHQGQCDDDVKYLSELLAIKRQLSKIQKDILIKELKEYGAWEDDELQDHEQNLQRILWLACGDIENGNL